jgi:hypothetical protein
MPGQRLRGRPKAATITSIPFPSCFEIEPETRDAFLVELREAHARGEAIQIVSPKAATPEGRRELTTSLRSAGVDPAITGTLGWATKLSKATRVQLEEGRAAPAAAPRADAQSTGEESDAA